MNTFFSYLSITAIFGYILMYQLGLGPIPYFIGSGKIYNLIVPFCI